MEQIRHKLIAFEGKAKASRVKAVMKWWTKCISMVIAKTASRNVAFKSDKLMDALFQEGQSAPQTPQTLFDADFEGLASNAEDVRIKIKRLLLSHIVCINMISP